MFNSIVSQILKDLPYTAGYFDDALIHSDEWNSHLSHLRNVFLAILKAGMKINFEKCEFGRASVDFLGFRVGLGKSIEKSINRQRTYLLVSSMTVTVCVKSTRAAVVLPVGLKQY